MKPDNKAGGPWLYALGLIPVVWFALLIAPSLSGGLSEIVNALPAAMNHPFQIVWCEDSIKAVLIFIAAYGLGIGIYLSSRRNYRRGEEHGSAKWGDPRAVNKKYRDTLLYTAIAPVPLSTFAGEPTQNVGKSFIKSYAAVCLEGAIIVLACIIFSLFAASPPAIDPNAAAVTQVWSYIGELVFNMLVLVGAVKMADRVVREMMGL